MDRSLILNLRVWWPSFIVDRWTLVLKSLFVEILELLMNHTQMLVSKTECLSVCKAFDSRHLVEQNQVIVLNIEIDGVQVLLQYLSIDYVDTSLFQAHTHDAAEDLEEILEHVFFRVLVEVLNLVAKWQHELLPLKSHVFGGDRGAFSAFESLPLQVLLGVGANKVKVYQYIVEANLALTILVVPLLVGVDGVAELTVHVS